MTTTVRKCASTVPNDNLLAVTVAYISKITLNIQQHNIYFQRLLATLFLLQSLVVSSDYLLLIWWPGWIRLSPSRPSVDFILQNLSQFARLCCIYQFSVFIFRVLFEVILD